MFLLKIDCTRLKLDRHEVEAYLPGGFYIFPFVGTQSSMEVTIEKFGFRHCYKLKENKVVKE